MSHEGRWAASQDPRGVGLEGMPVGPRIQEAAQLRGGHACVARVQWVGEKKKMREYAVAA